ncbi:MAG TPA: peptidyl-prolyl cis-trans isomerase [Vicinamibacterales bacterium]|nr:peptidyl-prolyl cis-trans isomerase [Vicinamibacterales bacterium]
MLDRMRRHRNWLKLSLLAVVATFILLYVPSFMSPTGAGAAPGDAIATVDGRKITVDTYRRAYQTQVQALRNAYGASLNDQMLRQLGIGQRIVQQLIDEEAVLVEARRIGITVSDAELRERLLRLPDFQENGQFVGEARYRAVLRMQRPPRTPGEFEDELRKVLTIEKLQGAVAGWVRVSDPEVEEEYRRRNEKVKLDLAIFTANQFRAGIQPTDAELQAQFSAHPDTYKMPEKRRVRYLSLSAEALRARMTVTPQEIEAKYQQNSQTYSMPEQIRASHILFKTEGKDAAVVTKQAEAVLAKVKAGGDFAALARQYSEDDQSKPTGGDLDYFGRGAMTPEFEEAAWALEVGKTSEIVKSPFGLHIIKLTDKKAAATKTLAEVRAQIEDQIRWEKAQAETSKIGEEIAKEIKEPSDLDRVAKTRSLTVGDSGLFSREEPLAGLGFAPAVSSEAFTMEQGKVSGTLRTTQGFAFITLAEIKPSFAPKLDEVKDKVREDVIKTKAVEVAKSKAAAMAQAAKSNFAAAAKAAGVEVKTTELITRGAALPEIGVSGAVDDAVFALKAGETTAPISTENAVVVARVKERQDVNPTEFQGAREGIRGELLQARRGQFFAAYMGKAKGKMQIEFNGEAIRTLLGGM